MYNFCLEEEAQELKSKWAIVSEIIWYQMSSYVVVRRVEQYARQFSLIRKQPNNVFLRDRIRWDIFGKVFMASILREIASKSDDTTINYK